jgi:isoprenylcysteine carboxyl methyltransferase (ICMT) family protein YpbQ
MANGLPKAARPVSRLTEVGRDEIAAPAPVARPESCASGWVSLAGLAGFFLSLVFMYGSALSPIHRSFVALAATVLPMITLDLFVLRVHRRASTGLVWEQVPPTGAIDARTLERVLVKLIGLAGTLALIGACYWLFPVYREPFYRPFWAALREAVPWFAAVAPIYVFYVDRRMAEPYDGYWQAGMAVLGRLDRVDREVLWQYALGWIIKGFFLPLMFVYLTNVIDKVMNAEFLAGQVGFLPFYRMAWDLAFAVDLVFVTAGYGLTLRLIDSHIRSAEPTLLGWTAALVCYQPFWGLAYGEYLKYGDNLTWSGWLHDAPVLLTVWGSAIIFLLIVYAWSNVAFGCRFSNLTHRGILTHGPFRWTKHPSYLSKNLIWWLVSVPFISNAGFGDAVRHCLLLLAVNAIYFLRARTEERHLSRDDIYVSYALWIEERGLFRAFGRALPFLRYAKPAG